MKKQSRWTEALGISMIVLGLFIGNIENGNLWVGILVWIMGLITYTFAEEKIK